MLLRPDDDPRRSHPLEWVVDADGGTWQLGSEGHLATLFIPLDAPLLVERGFVRAWQDQLDPFEDGYLTELIEGTMFVARKRISMCVLRVQTEYRSGGAEMIDAAARMAFPGIPEPSSVPPLLAAASVVEVTGPVRSRKEDDLSDFVDSAIDGVRRMQQAYGAATGEAHRLATRQSLPALTPVFLRSPDDDVATVRPEAVLMMMHARLPELEDLAEDVSAETISKMDGLIAQIEFGTPFMTSGLRLAEALRWIDAEGDLWPGIALLGTACEVMLDELLCSLLWESGRRPEECSKFLVGSITRRVSKGPLGDLLSGDWDVSGSGPIGNWNRDVARLRNEAMHLGRVPDKKEISNARDSAIALRDDLAARMMNAIDSFPRTAWFLLGGNKLPETLRVKHVQPLLNAASEVDWKTAASAWRRAAVYNTSFGRWSEKKAQQGDLELLAVSHADGETTWVVADTSCERGLLLGGAPEWLNTEQLAGLARPVSEASTTGCPISVRFELAGPLPTTGDWRAWYRLLPNQETLVTGPSLDPRP